MCVVVNIVRITLQWSDPKVPKRVVVLWIRLVLNNILSFKELWNVKNNGQDDWR